MPQKERVSAVRPQQIEQDADRGRLAGAVQPEKSENLSLDRFQVQIVDGEDVSVTLGESADGNRRHTTFYGFQRYNPTDER